MTWVTWLAISIAGGVGAAARYGADVWIKSRLGTAVPWSTLLINVAGSLVLGVLVGVVTGTGHADQWWVDTLGIGLLGGFTTFSTISVEIAALTREGRHARAALLAGGLLVTAVGAAALGWWLGALV
jgi:CrcB protein